MPPAPIGTGGDGEGADALEDVTLGHFTADPTAIGPFDHSLLSWHVDGVKPPVQVLLDTTQVTAAGQAVVQPPLTASYILSAKAGAARKTLGHVTVSVNTSTCDEVELPNLLVLLKEQIFLGIANRSDTYWSPGRLDDPNILSVSLSDEPLPRILVRAVFRQRVPYIPDAWVGLELAFGLGIQNGKFVAVGPSSNGSVEFDPLTSFFGGIILGLALALNDAYAKATQAGYDLIAGLIQYINIVELHPSVGKSPRYAVVTHRDGRPFVGYVECSVGPRGVTVVLTDVASTMSR
jgi:hypothetical protein